MDNITIDELVERLCDPDLRIHREEQEIVVACGHRVMTSVIIPIPNVPINDELRSEIKLRVNETLSVHAQQRCPNCQ